MAWDERFEKQYGFFRPWVKHVILEYLDCVDLHSGFATVKCTDFGHEYLVPYNVDPLVCPKCQGAMRIIAFIEQPEIIKKNPETSRPLGDPLRNESGQTGFV